MKGEPPLGNNAVVPIWMDGYIGGDAQLIRLFLRRPALYPVSPALDRSGPGADAQVELGPKRSSDGGSAVARGAVVVETLVTVSWAVFST